MHRHWHGCGPDEQGPRGHWAMGGRGFSFGPAGFHFDFGDGRGRGGWDGSSRGRRRPRLTSDELRLLVLFLIADKPRHGYDVIKGVEALTDGQYAPSPGLVYPTLTLLQDLGHIEEVPEEGSRKTYRATEEGRAWLEEQGSQVPELLERLDKMGGGHRRSENPPIGRAVGNLMTALRNRVAHEGFDEALVHEITEILDDAARRIERLD